MIVTIFFKSFPPNISRTPWNIIITPCIYCGIINSPSEWRLWHAQICPLCPCISPPHLVHIAMSYLKWSVVKLTSLIRSRTYRCNPYSTWKGQSVMVINEIWIPSPESGWFIFFSVLKNETCYNFEEMLYLLFKFILKSFFNIFISKTKNLLSI